MNFEYLAAYISTFAYLFPPFRQYRGKYFLFFLILALGNPITLLIVFSIHLDPKRIVCLIAWSMLLALVRFGSSKRLFIIKVSFSLFLLVGIFLIPVDFVQLISITIDYLILVYFLKEAIIYYKDSSSIHSGFVVLILYSMGLIFKLYLAISSLQLGHIYYYIMDLFEIIVAIFFTIYKVENSPKFKLQNID